MDPISFTAPQTSAASDVLEYRLQLIGSLTLNAFTTMPMLPWIVAEIKRKSLLRSKDSQPVRPVRLYVSSTLICCEPEPGDSQPWDPLICCSIFEHKPQFVKKLIHNSQDSNYFACLLKEKDVPHQQNTCYVFRAADQAKVSAKMHGRHL